MKTDRKAVIIRSGPTLLRLFRIMGSAWLPLTAIILLSLTSNALALLGPYWTGLAIDQMGQPGAGPNGIVPRLIQLLTMLAVLYGIGAVSQWLLGLLNNWLANHTVQTLRQQLFSPHRPHAARLPGQPSARRSGQPHDERHRPDLGGRPAWPEPAVLRGRDAGWLTAVHVPHPAADHPDRRRAVAGLNPDRRLHITACAA